MEGRVKEGPKLLLNQGPSEPCYATGLFLFSFSADKFVNNAAFLHEFVV